MKASHTVALLPIIIEFAEDKFDDEEIEFSYGEADTLSLGMRWHVSAVIDALMLLGLDYKGRNKTKSFRTFSSNCHDRWEKSGTHGGSGMSFGTWVGGNKHANH